MTGTGFVRTLSEKERTASVLRGLMIFEWIKSLNDSDNPLLWQTADGRSVMVYQKIEDPNAPFKGAKVVVQIFPKGHTPVGFPKYDLIAIYDEQVIRVNKLSDPFVGAQDEPDTAYLRMLFEELSDGQKREK